MSTIAFPGTPFLRASAAGVRGNVPQIWWGAPGLGKTATIENLGQAVDRHVETVVGSIRESSDFLGLPIEVDGEVRYAAPAFAKRLNQAKSGILFLDELTTSAPSVQKAMLRILQERFVGDEALSENVSIIAAANPPESGVDAMDLPAPVANRLMHLDYHFDPDFWLDNVASGFAFAEPMDVDGLLGEGGQNGFARAAGQIAGFLRSRPDLLAPRVPEDPEEQGKAWPSPRSWDNAIKVLAELHPADEDAALIVLRGCVGQGAAVEFFAWLATADLIDPAAVMDDPTLVNWKDNRPDRLFALTNSVASLAMMRGDKTSWGKALNVMVACAEGGRPDVAFPSVRTLLNRKPEGAALPVKVKETFTDLMVRTGRIEGGSKAKTGAARTAA